MVSFRGPTRSQHSSRLRNVNTVFRICRSHLTVHHQNEDIPPTARRSAASFPTSPACPLTHITSSKTPAAINAFLALSSSTHKSLLATSFPVLAFHPFFFQPFIQADKPFTVYCTKSRHRQRVDVREKHYTKQTQENKNKKQVQHRRDLHSNPS